MPRFGPVNTIHRGRRELGDIASLRSVGEEGSGGRFLGVVRRVVDDSWRFEWKGIPAKPGIQPERGREYNAGETLGPDGRRSGSSDGETRPEFPRLNGLDEWRGIIPSQDKKR